MKRMDKNDWYQVGPGTDPRQTLGGVWVDRPWIGYTRNMYWREFPEERQFACSTLSFRITWRDL